MLTGQRGLVVGGSTGIGGAIAEAWARDGMDVLVLSRTKPANDLRWAPIDLADPAQATALDDLGPLDAVAFAAVYYGDKRATFAETPLTQWRQQVEVNLHGLWLTLKATLPALRDSNGLFVNVSSEVVFNGGPGRSGYAATKAACASLVDSVQQEEDGVQFVSVLPAGMVDSPGIRKRRPSDFDYSGYMRPETFGPLVVELAETKGKQHNGDSLIVNPDGSWESVRHGVPVSQSDRSRL